MSHIVEAQSDVASLDLLEAAARRLGLHVERDATPRYYGSAWGGNESKRCELVVRLPGKYDLGAKVYADGHIGWVCDSELLTGEFGRRDEGRRLLGENAEVLMGAYAEAKVELELMQAGVSFTRTVAENGDVHYEIDESQFGRVTDYAQVN